jgi:predicted hotdog family 3-hydroxylacyl-ACP dehydratase
MNAMPEIAELVPHAGRMVLLQRVLDWDAERIRCMTASHRQPDNPLRRDGRLAAVNGAEYGAQAAAIHGALNGRAGDGYLVAARDLTWTRARLDDIETELLVSAERVMVQPRAVIYRFRIDPQAEADGANSPPVVSGQVTIFLGGETAR